MKILKTALLAGALASLSTMAFAQASGPTTGVDFRSVYSANNNVDGGVHYARAGQHQRTRAVNQATIRQRETTGSGYTSGGGIGSPD